MFEKSRDDASPGQGRADHPMGAIDHRKSECSNSALDHVSRSKRALSTAPGAHGRRGCVAWPGSNGPSAWLSMPAIVLLQADRALCLDDLLEGRRRQLVAALACRVARAHDQDVQPVDPMSADPRVRPRASTQLVGTVDGEGGQASLRVEARG